MTIEQEIRKLTIEILVREVAGTMDFRIYFSRTRKKKYVEMRRLVYKELKEAGYSTRAISKALGKSRATIISALKRDIEIYE